MRPAMGTLVQVDARGPDVERSIEAAFAAIHQVDRLMSFHDPQSELSRLNREAARSPQSVHSWTRGVLRRALNLHEASAGLFDVTVTPLLVKQGLLPGATNTSLDCGVSRDIVLMPDGKVFFKRPVLVDLGGIAKGFAIDMAIHALRRGGCVEAAVNAGGDLRRFGPEARPIHLRRREGFVKVADLRRGAIATSAPRIAHPDRLAQPLGSIFDPHSRLEWNGRGAVMVAAPTCVIADALTKVAALAGPSSAPLLARFGASAFWDTAVA
ncbi:MAG TPA: FAD:protein FMN transferase [Burkholderiales bacterium]|nr:FAD:protein FMN transferase [Burkholderiales bacterium]